MKNGPKVPEDLSVDSAAFDRMMRKALQAALPADDAAKKKQPSRKKAVKKY